MHLLESQKFCCSRATYISRAERTSAGYAAENLRRLLDYLRQHPCVDCGEPDPVVLDLDHREPSLKRTAVSVLIWRTSWAIVEQALARCDVRCADCHRRRTAVQLGWRKLAGAAGLEPATCRFGDDRSTD